MGHLTVIAFRNDDVDRLEENKEKSIDAITDIMCGNVNVVSRKDSAISFMLNEKERIDKCIDKLKNCKNEN